VSGGDGDSATSCCSCTCLSAIDHAPFGFDVDIARRSCCVTPRGATGRRTLRSGELSTRAGRSFRQWGHSARTVEGGARGRVAGSDSGDGTVVG
jgi:hypothetical protein